MAEPIEVFFSYSHKDDSFREQLEDHLVNLKRQGLIKLWHSRMINAGSEWENQIDENLSSADIILLLITVNFIASDYCYDIEMKRALELHDAGKTRVIPIMITPVEGWSNFPFAKLEVLPSNRKPVIQWSNTIDAFVKVAEGIRSSVEEIRRAKDVKRSFIAEKDSGQEELSLTDKIHNFEKKLEKRFKAVLYVLIILVLFNLFFFIAPNPLTRSTMNYVSNKLNFCHVNIVPSIDNLENNLVSPNILKFNQEGTYYSSITGTKRCSFSFFTISISERTISDPLVYKQAEENGGTRWKWKLSDKDKIYLQFVKNIH